MRPIGTSRLRHLTLLVRLTDHVFHSRHMLEQRAGSALSITIGGSICAGITVTNLHAWMEGSMDMRSYIAGLVMCIRVILPSGGGNITGSLPL